MQKKKVKIIFEIGKLIARTWIINIPAVFILLVLMMLDKLNWLSALMALFCFWGLSAVIVFFIFKDLDDFISYLNKLAEGVSEELPKFDKSLFSSRRLANAFQAVSSLWQKQALTDTSILENLPDPLVMINSENKIVFLNQAGKKLFTPKELNQNIFDVFKITPSNQKKTFFFKWQKKQKNKTVYFQVRMDTLAFPSRLGATHTFVLHDITSFEEFHKQQADFFANASHELKTPLAILSGAIETLQGPAQNDPKAQGKFLNLMAKQTRHMNELIQNFLDLAHLQQKNKESHLEKINLNVFLSELCQNFQTKAVQKKQNLSFIPSDVSVSWVGKKLDMKYICQNLIDNALKYAPFQADITVELKNNKKDFSISVFNTGSYIAPLYRTAIFERFYRINKGLKDTPEGSGLGLNIVRFLVQKYQGQIILESTLKKGTTFRLNFPLSS